MEGHKRTVWHVMYSPDNQQLASASGDNTARLWDVETGNLFMELKGHTEPVTFLSYSFQGASLATCSIDTTIRMYASCTSQNSVPPVCRSPKSRERVWRPESGNGRGKGGAGGWSLCSPVKARLAQMLWCLPTILMPPALCSLGCGVGRLHSWDPATGKGIHTLSGHHEWVTHCCYSPEGGVIASASTDCTIRVWNLASGDCHSIIQDHVSDVNSVCIAAAR